jgi:hypothetical protein
MELKKTLNNLRKSKESIFNLKRGDTLFFDIYKNNLICYTEKRDAIKGLLYHYINSKTINKHFINWDWNNDSDDDDKLIKSTEYNFWFETRIDLGFDVPFHYKSKKLMGNFNLLPKIL